MPPLWTFEKVTVQGPTCPRLRCDDLSIWPGVTAVMGESGAGKSTLLNLLVGFSRPDAGHLHATIPRGQADLPLFWAPQNEGLWPHLTVRQQLMAASGRKDEVWCDELLQELELGALASRPVDSLAVGEQSRLAVARAVSAEAAVTVFDEPLSHVDRARRATHWQQVLTRLRTIGGSVVFASHSPRMVLGHAERAILLRDGCVSFVGRVDDLYWRPASAEDAAVLGPVNWLERAAASLWMPGAAEARNYRPAELRLEAASAEAPLQLLDARHGGDVTTVRLRHTPSGQERHFNLLSLPLPENGQPVRLVAQPVTPVPEAPRRDPLPSTPTRGGAT